MTEEELKIKKLELEISEISKPEWRKPAYTISVLTIVISALIGFGQYYNKVDSDNFAKIEKLENTIAKNKEQQHKMEIATSKYETLIIKKENEEEKKKNKSLQEQVSINQRKLDKIENDIRKKGMEFLRLKKEYNGFKNLVKKTLEKNKQYSQEYANGVINSSSGQDKIREIIELDDLEMQRKEIGIFAFGVMNQTNEKSSKKIINEIGLK
jgi:hypothetical protein|tara:strand:+ start:317 stop:949 length:633 start_codon:yes stop_codon:yes gene_type:complete